MYKIIVRKNYKDNRRYYKPGDLLEDGNGNHLAFDTITETAAYIKELAPYDAKVLDWRPEIGGGDRMKTIQCRTFSSRLGWHWKDYLSVQDERVRSVLRKLRRNNPNLEFRLDEPETDADVWRMYAQASHAVGMQMR